MEAISTLIVEFVIESLLRSVVAEHTDTVIRQFSQAVRERLRQGGKPVNHDLQRAVRKAYLQATIVLLDSYLGELGIAPSWLQRDIRHLFRQPKDLGQLFKARRAILHELNQIPKSSYIPPASEAEQQIELLLQPRGEIIQVRLDEFKKRLKDQLQQELRHRWEVHPPERLIAMLRNGWEVDQKGTSVVLDWFELMCAFFAEELKQNERVAHIFQSQLLANLSVAGLSVDYRAFTQQLEQLAGQAMSQLRQIEQMLEQLRKEQAEGFNIVLERLNEYLPLLLTRAEAIQTLLQTLQPELRRRPLYEKYAGLELAQRTERVIRMHTALFVGRERELEQLDALFTQPSGTLIVTAPAGYGKTTLLANWIDQRHRNGCFIAYHFFRKEYDDANRLDSVANALFNLLRQLYIYYAIDSELPPRDEVLLRDALVGLLQERGALPEEPLVLLLDGLDEAEQELLLTLPSPLPEGVYGVVSVRAEETEIPTALRMWMPATRMHLRTLSRVAISDYLARAGDGELAAYAQDAAFVDQVYDKTAGYPLHLRFLADELLQLAKSDGDVRAALAHTPKGFDEYVRAQLRYLARNLKNAEKVQNLFALLTTALGALGEREIETLTGLNAFELAALPREATRWFSITTRNGECYYAFTHPMLGDAFERALGTLAHNARQQLLDYCARWREHRSPYALRHYPSHLREENRTDDLYLLARDEMFLQAQRETLPAEPDLPLRTLQIALDAAIAQENAPVIAEMMLRHARRTMSDETPLHALHQGNLERAIGLAKLLLERDYKIGTLWMLMLAWKRHHAGDAANAERLLKEILRWWGRQTLEKLRQVQAETAIFLLTPLSQLPSASEVAAQTLGDEALKLLVHRWVQIGVYDQALTIAQQIKGARSRSEALTEIALAMAQRGEFEQALAIARQIKSAQSRSEALTFKELVYMMRRAGTHGHWKTTCPEALTFKEIALAMATSGAAEEAQAILQQALEATQQIEDARFRSVALTKIARAMAHTGVYDQALTIAQQIEEAFPRSWALTAIAEIIAQTNAPREQVQEILKQALSIVSQIKDEYERSLILADIAFVKMQAGVQSELAQDILQQSIDTAQQIRNKLRRSRALAAIARAMVDTGISSNQVEPILQRALPTAQRAEEIYRGFNLEEIDELTVTLMDLAQAMVQIGALDQALTVAQRIWALPERDQALTAIAQAMAQKGTFDQAIIAAQPIMYLPEREQALTAIAQAVVQAGVSQEELKEIFQRARATALKGKRAEDRGWALINTAWLMAQVGAPPDWMEDILNHILATAQQTEDYSMALAAMARAIARMGAFELALTIAQPTENITDPSRAVIAPSTAQTGDFVQPPVSTRQPEWAFVRSEALQEIAQVMAQAGYPSEQVQEVLQQASTAAQQVENTTHRSNALRNVAVAMAQAGAFDQAIAIAQQIEPVSSCVKALTKIAQAMAQAGTTPEQVQNLLQQPLMTLTQRNDCYQEAYYMSDEIFAELVRSVAQAGAYELAIAVSQKLLFASQNEALAEVVKMMAEAGLYDQALEIVQRLCKAGEDSKTSEEISQGMEQTGSPNQDSGG